MKKHFSSGALPFCVPFVLAATFAHGQITPKDTVVPNQFEFTSAQYFVSSGATNAVITVRFFPGGRSWSGSVNYATRDGTARAPDDYFPISGTLNFSGTPYQSFMVPLTGSPTGRPKTILLLLSPNAADSNALITRSNAILNIDLPPPPNVAVSRGASGTVVISWSDDGTGLVLEKFETSTAASWTILASAVPVDSGGQCSYTDTSSTGMALYRLRRPQ